MNYDFVDDVKTNKNFRQELGKLIGNDCRKTIDSWMLKGHSVPNYRYCGLVDKRGKLVVAIGLIQTRIFDHSKIGTAIQMGNVFFRKYNAFTDEQKAKLEQDLLAKVMKKYQTLVDFAYYYGNGLSETLIDELGLKQVQEYKYYLDLEQLPTQKINIEPINLNDPVEFENLWQTVRHSAVVAKKTFDISNDVSIKMYNIDKYYQNDIYKVPSLDLIGVFQKHKKTFKIIAVFAKHQVNLIELINGVVPLDVERIEFGFNPGPSLAGLKVICEENMFCEVDSQSPRLYIKEFTWKFSEQMQVMLPILSRQS